MNLEKEKFENLYLTKSVILCCWLMNWT